MTTLTDSQREGLRRLRANAENNKLSLALMQKLCDQPLGSTPRRFTEPLQFEFLPGKAVAYSIEEQPEPFGWLRHVSFYGDPGQELGRLICQELGFLVEINALIPYLEGDALNLIQPLDNAPEKVPKLIRAMLERGIIVVCQKDSANPARN